MITKLVDLILEVFQGYLQHWQLLVSLLLLAATLGPKISPRNPTANFLLRLILPQSRFKPPIQAVSADWLVYPFNVWMPLADHVDAGKNSCQATSASRRLFVTVVAEKPIPVSPSSVPLCLQWGLLDLTLSFGKNSLKGVERHHEHDVTWSSPHPISGIVAE